VLGVTEHGNSITIVSGWNWYLGADPGAIGADQYDFQTVVAHELGHALRMAEGSDPTSVMYGYLSGGVARRLMSANDFGVIAQDTAGGPATPPVDQSSLMADVSLSPGSNTGLNPSDGTSREDRASATDRAVEATALAGLPDPVRLTPRVEPMAGNAVFVQSPASPILNGPTAPASVTVPGGFDPSNPGPPEAIPTVLAVPTNVAAWYFPKPVDARSEGTADALAAWDNDQPVLLLAPERMLAEESCGALAKNPRPVHVEGRDWSGERSQDLVAGSQRSDIGGSNLWERDFCFESFSLNDYSLAFLMGLAGMMNWNASLLDARHSRFRLGR
jgi:hypothetical protein